MKSSRPRIEKKEKSRGRTSGISLIESVWKFIETFASERINAILRPLYFQKLRSSSSILLGDFGWRCRCESCTCEENAFIRIYMSRSLVVSHRPSHRHATYRYVRRCLLMCLWDSQHLTLSRYPPTYECLMRRP